VDVNPASIEADRQAGLISISWDDGHQSEYRVEALRWACPCAVCQGEWGRPGRLSSLDRLSADELTLTDVTLVGGYALCPVWASGHNSGIYSFEYLRDLCPCPACRQAR